MSGDPVAYIVEITMLSLAVSGAATLISVLIGLPLGTWLALSRMRSRRVILSTVNTGMALPPVVVGLVVALLLWRSGILGDLGLMYTPGAMVIAEVVIAAPVMAGLTAAGLGQLDPRLQLQLQGLGASRWQTVWWLWREARLPLLAALMAAFRSVISEVGAAMMPAGTSPTRPACSRPRSCSRPVAASSATRLSSGSCCSPSPSWSTASSPGRSSAGRVPDGRPAPRRRRLASSRGCSRRGPRSRRRARWPAHPRRRRPRDRRRADPRRRGAERGRQEHPAPRPRPSRAPERGTITFAGLPLGARDELAHRRRIGLALPAPLLLSTSVFDNVAAGLRFRGVRAAETRERVETWLERLRIAHLRDRQAGQLSTGEAQRVSLARAFVLEPELLLLDEPFASLDPGTRAELTDDFEQLRRGTSTTCVLVTHDLNEAVRLGDRLAVLLEGRIRQVDEPARVLAEPAGEHVAAFVGAPAGIRGRVLAARDGLVVVDTGSGRGPDVSARAEALLRATADPAPASPDTAHDVDTVGTGTDPGPADPGGS